MRVYRWGAATNGLDACDATIELELESPQGIAVSAFVHTRLVQRDGRWLMPDLTTAQTTIENYLREHAWEIDSNLGDARWLVQPPPLDTRAKRWPGAARAEVTRVLALVDEDWMQDWPLEVADATHLEPAMALYDASTNPDVRFDAMALALFAYDQRTRAGTADDATHAWFATRLNADIAAVGHLAAYWSVLHLGRLTPDESFAISERVRQIFWDSLREIPLAEVDVAAPSA